VIFFYIDMALYEAFKEFSLGKSDLYDFQSADFEILNSSTLIDFSTCTPSMFNRLLQLTEDQRVKVDYSLIFHNKNTLGVFDIVLTHEIEVKYSDEKNIMPAAKEKINGFAKECEDKKNKAIGYLPWKLLRSDVIIEERDDKWIEKAKPQIHEALKEINELRQAAKVEVCETVFSSEELIDY
jgi:hypothetical protein